jgi:hypothetical protein
MSRRSGRPSDPFGSVICSAAVEGDATDILTKFCLRGCNLFLFF